MTQRTSKGPHYEKLAQQTWNQTPQANNAHTQKRNSRAVLQECVLQRRKATFASTPTKNERNNVKC